MMVSANRTPKNCLPRDVLDRIRSGKNFMVYHGTPITPNSVFEEHMRFRNVLVSFARPDQFKLSLEHAKEIMIDNGAFSIWTRNKRSSNPKKTNWDSYFKWIDEIYSDITEFILPDVIDGSEEENDHLLTECSLMNGMPVWHVNESYDRLERLAADYPYIAFGSAGEYGTLGTDKWNKKVSGAMKLLSDDDDVPVIKVHMLRCLNHKVFSNFAFYSGDSTNLARNHARDTPQKILSRLSDKDGLPSKEKHDRLQKDSGRVTRACQPYATRDPCS